MILTRYKKKCCRKYFRQWTKLKEYALCVIKFYMIKYLNRIDPISLARIRKKIDIVRNKCLISYDVVNLYEYIISSGDFKDPISRIEYDSCELTRISNLMKFVPYHLINLKQFLIKKRNNEMELRSLCSVFESEINDHIIMLCEEENVSFSHDFVPLTIQAFENYKSIDPYHCKLFLQNTLSRIFLNPIPNIDLRLQLVHFIRVLISCSN